MVGRWLSSVVAAVARRPVPVLAAAGVLVVVGAIFALRLEPSAATDTLVGRNTAEYRATQRHHEKFGDDAVIILERGPLSKLVLTSDILRSVYLEGCISGNVPKGKTPPGGPDGPCAQLARTKPVKVVFGPGTFINEAVGKISDEFVSQQRQAKRDAAKVARAARKLALARGMSPAQANQLAQQAAQLRAAQFERDVIALALKYGITSAPTLNNPQFVSRLVFSNKGAPGTPKPKFAYLFPTRNSALIQVRLKPDLNEAQRRHAIGLIRQAIAMPTFQMKNGGSYVVTGAPVVVNDLTGRISHSIIILLIAAILVMAGTLAVVFRARARLLPLLIALAAAAVTFGGLSAAGASLTMASIAVLPVLIGLAVDYAIQFQSRVEETGDEARAALLGGPTLLTAGAATAAGFLALVLSPVPMVRGFGILLIIGVVVAFIATFTAGAAMLVVTRGRRAPRPLRTVSGWLEPAWRGAGELLTETRPALAVRRATGRVAGGALRAAIQHPGRVLGIALVAAVAGWALDTQTHVESDIQKLVPQDLHALRDLRALEDSTGVGGEIDVVVDSENLTDPATVAWMTRYQKALLTRYGFKAGRGCGQAELCPAFSLPDLFSGGGVTSRTDIETLL